MTAIDPTPPGPLEPPRVCDPDEFLAASPSERRKLVLAQIDLTPELWNQDTWLTVVTDENTHTCYTAGCFAGWATILSGQRPSELWVKGIASSLLGLSVSESDSLFAGSNTRDDIVRILGMIDRGEIGSSCNCQACADTWRRDETT